jgi:hypothetical protein
MHLLLVPYTFLEETDCCNYIGRQEEASKVGGEKSAGR